MKIQLNEYYKFVVYLDDNVYDGFYIVKTLDIGSGVYSRENLKIVTVGGTPSLKIYFNMVFVLDKYLLKELTKLERLIYLPIQ